MHLLKIITTFRQNLITQRQQTLRKRSVKIEDNTMVYFVDDVFTVKKKRVKEIR